MKRILYSLLLSALMLAGCTDPDKMPVITNVSLDHFGGVGFAEDGKAITYATLTVNYVSPSTKQIEIMNVLGSVRSKDGKLISTISMPVGDVVVIKPESEDSFTQALNVKMEGSLLQMVAGGISSLKNGTLDVDADFRYGNHKKHFSKRGIPLEEFIRKYQIKSDR